MAYLLLALIPSAFALNVVIARALGGEFGPGTLSALRWFWSAALIGGFVWWRGRSERWPKDWPEVMRLAQLGALGMGFCSYAAYAGTQTATATTVGLMYSSTAAVVATYEILRGGLKPSPLLVGGIASCITGVGLILTKGHLETLLATKIGAGELWALAGMLVWAYYTVALNRSKLTATPLAQFTIMTIAATAVCLPPTVLELVTNGWPVARSSTPIWIAALVLYTSIFAFIGYSWSIGLSGPVLTAASITLVPLYVAGLAIVLIGEDVRWYHGVAIALVIAGLGAIQASRAKRS